MILPGVCSKISSNAGITSRSEGVLPGTVEFVESESSASTPASPYFFRVFRSYGAPTTGDWDAFTGYRDREQVLPEDDADVGAGGAGGGPRAPGGAPGRRDGAAGRPSRSVGYRPHRPGAR